MCVCPCICPDFDPVNLIQKGGGVGFTEGSYGGHQRPAAGGVKRLSIKDVTLVVNYSFSLTMENLHHNATDPLLIR